jgi:hypothetical protein
MKLARLGIHASNLCSSSSNLHGEFSNHRLSLEISLLFDGALLLKECHLLLGVY